MTEKYTIGLSVIRMKNWSKRQFSAICVKRLDRGSLVKCTLAVFPNSFEVTVGVALVSMLCHRRRPA